MTKLDWDKASRKSKIHRESRLEDGQRRYQETLQKYVDTYDLKCFVCKSVSAQWAKVGKSKYGHWVICSTCVQRGK